MPGNPFFDPKINRQIKTRILRLQATSLEWGEDPAGRGLDDHIVETLVESLNAHAELYLHNVNSDELVASYVGYLRDVGSALVRNAEQRSYLSDPYSEAEQRKMIENTGAFIRDKHSRTPEQNEAEILKQLERLCISMTPEALQWNGWKNQIVFRIETRFEASYRRWEAAAIEQVDARQGNHVLVGAVPQRAEAPGRGRSGPIPCGGASQATKGKGVNEQATLESDAEPLTAALAPEVTTVGEATTGNVPLWPVKLRAARAQMNLSREALVRKIVLVGGPQLTEHAIKKHEEGRSKPKSGMRKAYALVYKTSEDLLFGR